MENAWFWVVLRVAVVTGNTCTDLGKEEREADAMCL